ncbi:hypothetical protein P171DRAFT_491866 [Karstenula rhodostoma CBS 690.94]|uniref:Heterokaryon incompatibility domain-containing protein n=1 Tax=Karstenula rhodostoma CBS 690.94 TaxID=1392251 RepID=A0A9P4P698_9PLEO|nr:hypothetical protein P171DRAFT_491866 [Karstenula rhodostoma CBS 690.94]
MSEGDTLAVGEKSAVNANCSLCRRKPHPKQDFEALYTQLEEATSHKCSRCSFIYAVVEYILSNEILRPDIQTRGIFQDTVEICRRLSIFYLWIDSLCIIQDDAKDWQLHAAQMADMYEHGLVTIAATKSRDGSGGCFSQTEEVYMGKRIPGYGGLFVRKHVCDFHNSTAEPFAPLKGRAWTYQELTLSPRIIYPWDQEVIWQCKRCLRHEGDGGGFFDSNHEHNLWNDPSV